MTGLSRQPNDTVDTDGERDTPARARAAATATRRLRLLEDDLVGHSIAFAKTNGYAPYTTTLRAAWVEAVRSLTEALSDFLVAPAPGPRGPQAEAKYRQDPRFARMRDIARRHRSLGITLEMYLGLFKHFRRVYLDALRAEETLALRTHILDRTLDFFDETELSVTADWTATRGDARLSELQAQTRSLTLAKDRYIAIFESLRNPACLLDRARGLVHANQAALDLFVAETEAGDSLYRHGRRALVTRVEEMLVEVLDRDETSGSTVWIDTVDGRRCFDVRLLRLHDAVENTALGFLVQLYDVTSYREATDTAQRAEQQMSRFLATMSHEIRTPLHAVLGAADLMRQSGPTERDTYLDVIQGAGQSLLHTLNNVLDYSKLENGPPTPQPVETELASALQSFCGMAVVGPGSDWTRLSLAMAPDVPPRVRIDWAMTRQVLTNLVMNALRHDHGGGVVLRVGHVDGRLRFEVVDHGPGLPPQEAEALFRPFDEVSARPTDAGGTGLGLAISRLLVGSLGGRIDYDTTAQGTRIWFDLPFRVADKAPGADKAPAPAPSLPGRRCLLVDDDEIGALVTRRQLERADYTVSHAASTQAARALFARSHFDAVVIDYLLPDGTGPDLLADLRRSGRAAHTRFVALTANAEALRASSDLRAGFAHILAKPTDSKSLADALAGSPDPEPGRAPPADAASRCDLLDGLSPETVAAMADAYARQWSELRQRLGAARAQGLHKGAQAELQELAHRLAGSGAQLGLTEFEAPLRALERRLETGDSANLTDLVDQLDRPLESTHAWQSLHVQDPVP